MSAEPTSRSDQFARWTLFVVLIPLVPIVANILAQWLDVDHFDGSVVSLFGNGELLVLGTVVAAAGAGDLLFDPERHRRKRDFWEALAISVALVVALVCALIYGLVTLKAESGGVLRADRQQAVQALQVETASLMAQSQSAAQDYAHASERSVDEMLGVKTPDTTGIAGTGSQELEFRQEALQAEKSAAASRLLADSAQLRLNAAERQLLKSDYSTNRQTALISIMMFLISLCAGMFCVFVGTRRSRSFIGRWIRRLRERQPQPELPFEEIGIP